GDRNVVAGCLLPRREVLDVQLDPAEVREVAVGDVEAPHPTARCRQVQPARSSPPTGISRPNVRARYNSVPAATPGASAPGASRSAPARPTSTRPSPPGVSPTRVVNRSTQKPISTNATGTRASVAVRHIRSRPKSSTA